MGSIITVHYDKNPIYNITIEHDFKELSSVLQKLDTKGHRICVVADSLVASLYLDDIMNIVKNCALEAISFVFEAGEKSKNLDTVTDLYEKLVKAGFDRKDTLIALGGGVTGDLTGFAAATYLRGIRVIQLPTSLLAMVDSSIGGKTGVDFRGYKNMVGAFHQPSAVYMNISTLKTLTDKQYYSGFGEIVKHGLIRDIKYFKFIEENYDKINARDPVILEKIVAGSCEIKRAVVENDPLEKGERAVLNFGHTLGHSIEKLKNFTMLHGECVSVGMAAALYISMNRGMINESEYKKACKVLQALNLPLAVKDLSSEDIIKVSKSDKKMDAGKIKFILLDGIGNAVIKNDVTDYEMTEALTTGSLKL